MCPCSSLVGKDHVEDRLLDLVRVLRLVREELQQAMVDVGPEHAAAGLAGVVFLVGVQEVADPGG